MSNTDKTFSKRKEASLLPTLPSPALLLEATIPIIYIRKIQAWRAGTFVKCTFSQIIWAPSRGKGVRSIQEICPLSVFQNSIY